MADLGAYHHARGRQGGQQQQQPQPPGASTRPPPPSHEGRPGLSPGRPGLPAADAPRLPSSPHRLLPSPNAPAPSTPRAHLTSPHHPHLSPNILPPLRSLDRAGPSYHPPPPLRASPVVYGARPASQRVPLHPPFPHPLTMSSPSAPTGYYPPPGQPAPMQPQPVGAPTDPNQPLRYALPAADNRNLHGRSGKKEIKRRTKTGCMTCRRRRIKVS